MVFSKYVESLRKKGKTQSDVAEELGKARCTINRWCNGGNISNDDILAVQKWSGGRVKPLDWFKKS